jgi:hypothetical protein
MVNASVETAFKFKVIVYTPLAICVAPGKIKTLTFLRFDFSFAFFLLHNTIHTLEPITDITLLWETIEL